MTSSDRRAAFLAAADQIEAWAATVPRWSQGSAEPWWLFLDRRFQAENTIIARLRATPSCRIETCPAREYVELHLGGLRVSTQQGLAAALRAWAALARKRWGEASAPGGPAQA